jgi:hypothetical protein
MGAAHMSSAKMSAAAPLGSSGVPAASAAMLVICRRRRQSHESGNRKCG